MQFHTLALGTVLTIATLMSTQSVTHANPAVKTIAQVNEPQATQYQAVHLQTTEITLSPAPSSLEHSPQLQDTTGKNEAYVSLIKNFMLSINKDSERQSSNVPSYPNISGFISNPSFDGESTLGPSVGYRHLNLYGNPNY